MLIIILCISENKLLPLVVFNTCIQSMIFFFLSMNYIHGYKESASSDQSLCTGNALQLLGFIFKVMVNFPSGGNSGDQLCQKKDETETFSSSSLCQLQTNFCQSQSILLLTSLNSAYFWLFLLLNFFILKHFLPLALHHWLLLLFFTYSPFTSTLTSSWG